MKKNIAVLMGGYSLEYDISIKSGLNVFNSIDKLKFNVFKVIIEKESWYYLDDENQKFEINKKNFSVNDDLKFDLAFIVIHGDPGENGKIQNYFDSISIPYTGCSSEVSKMTFSKKNCIESVKKLNVKTAKSFIINKHNDYDLLQISDELKYPFFVKANNSGSSFGVYKVYDKKELESAVIENFTIDNEIILEEGVIKLNIIGSNAFNMYSIMRIIQLILGTLIIGLGGYTYYQMRKKKVTKTINKIPQIVLILVGVMALINSVTSTCTLSLLLQDKSYTTLRIE